VNVLFSDQGSEIFNAFPLSFPAERGGEQINKELLWNSELSFYLMPFLWYCVDGKLCTTFLWIAIIGGPISFYSSIINSNSSMHGKEYRFLFRVLTLKGTFIWRWNPDAIVFNSELLGAKILQRVKWSNSSWR
jgi:hypothetical protein